MATVKNFEDLEVWKKSRDFSKKIFMLSSEGSFSKDFSLRDQINRATGSVMDNIAEGFERGGRKEFIQFLSFSKGSAGEVRTQLYRALDRKHIEAENFEILLNEITEISKMITGLMAYLQKSEVIGWKFKKPIESNQGNSNFKL